MNYELKYKQIASKIHSVRRKETFIMLATGVFSMLAVGLTALTISVLIESIANGDSTFRTILAGIIFSAFVVGFGMFAIKPLLRFLGIKNNPSDDEIAIRIGHHYPEIKDNLCNTMQLIPLVKDPKGSSPELIIGAFENVIIAIENKNFDVIINRKNLQKSVVYFLIPLVILLGLVTLSPNVMGESLNRIANFNQSFLPLIPYELSINPKYQKILRGQNAIITVNAKGEAPETIKLNVKEENQQNFDIITLRLDSGNVYKYEIPSLKTSLEFFASAEWYNSQVNTEIGKIIVIDKPIIRSISGRVIFPSYTKIAPQVINEQNADISALNGSRVEFQIFSNKDIAKANIIYEKMNLTSSKNDSSISETVEIPLNANGKKATGDFRISSSGTYHIELIDKDGNSNEDPISYSIIAMNDAFPSITLIEPTYNVEVSKNALLPIKLTINDDYGFSALKLMWRLAESPYSAPDKDFKSINILFDRDLLSNEINYIWDLNKLNITPEDKYEFYIAVADNDIVLGPKIAKTQTLSVRLPSLDEIYEENQMVQKNIEKEMEKILKEANQVKDDIEQLNRELMKDTKQNKENKPLDWKEKKTAEDILKKQMELAQKMENLQEDLKQATEKLDDNNMISPETMQKYMELQNLMKEINSPEFKKMQENMQKALQNMSEKDLQKAMEKFKFSDEQFRKNIERTMKLLQRMQAEQKADALEKRAEELAKRQDELTEETKKANPNSSEQREDLAKKQEKLRQDMNKLNEDLKALEKLMKEIGENEMPMDMMEDAKDALDAGDTDSEMQSAEQSAKGGEMEKSAKSQKKASSNLKKFAKKMNEMKNQLKKMGKEEAIRKMEKAISDMLKISKEQENLKNQTAKADYNSTKLPEYARQQAEAFESLANVANSMVQLSQKSLSVTPEMGDAISNALQNMQKSVEQMAERQSRQASQSQTAAMGAMNNAVGQMQDMVNNLKQSGQGSCSNPGGTGEGQGQGENQGQGQGGMGFQQRMQQMAAQQQQINQALQQMMQGGMNNSGSMSQEQQSQLQRLTDQQGQVQKSMQELANEQKKFAQQSGDKQKADEMGKISQELKEVMSDMRSKGDTPETLKKQDRILSRLLDAVKSENDRDYEKNRESKTGKEYNIESPNAIDFSTQEGKNKLIRDILNNSKNQYTKDYENLIRTYFENLDK